ncbi:arylamine N-acetyltransferase family protein [Ruegeria atlantica]|uniref:arylamine N-acetyltransferase family protein n=1 Tax=Ruegeria atlantica TaxID=81569 RepID=UPI002494E245|nr:arylamine N-acetyltransferase [Ruegeria atlantica]
MDLENYLDRIAYSGDLKPDRVTLDNLFAAQLRMVAFENIDQQLGVPVSFDENDVFEKVVTRKRGGWCFELNSLFSWVLQEIGFQVSYLAGYVGPDKPSPDQTPDHMLLNVECDEHLLVDVGFGGAMSTPIPLEPFTGLQQPYNISLTAQRDGFVEYSESAGGGETGYWFTQESVEPSVFQSASRHLQTDPNSPFLRTLTAQRRYTNRHIILRGLVMRTIDTMGIREETISTPKELVDCLKYDFGLNVPAVAEVWPKFKKRHDELFHDKVR